MNTRKLFSEILLSLFTVALALGLSSCNDSGKEKSVKFQDAEFKSVVAAAFDKQPDNLTQSDCDDVVVIHINYFADRVGGNGNSIQYKDAWAVTVYKDGYHAAYEEYFNTPEDEREGLKSPYEFAYNQKLDSFSGFTDLLNFKNVRDIYFSCDHRVVEINPLSFISHMRSLENLSISNFVVPNLNIISKFPNLKSLNIGVNYRQLVEGQEIEYITDISPLSNLKKLETLSFTGTLFNDFTPLSKLENLKSLTCSMAALSDISSVSELKSLEYVNFYYNAISDVTPLMSLPNLKNIILDYNYITDISPFADLKADNIEYISLDMNSIEDLTPIKHLGEDKVYVGYEFNWD